MSFTFSMQKILDYRAMLEEQAKVQLVKAQTMLKREEDRFESLRLQIAEKENEMFAKVCMDSAERWLFESFIKGLQSDLSQSHARLRQLYESVNACKEVVLIRAKDKKVLEKLKEKQQERHYVAEKEQERKVNDEAATIRYKMVTI